MVFKLTGALSFGPARLARFVGPEGSAPGPDFIKGSDALEHN